MNALLAFIAALPKIVSLLETIIRLLEQERSRATIARNDRVIDEWVLSPEPKATAVTTK